MDHRCVRTYMVLPFRSVKPQRFKGKRALKQWQPVLEEIKIDPVDINIAKGNFWMTGLKNRLLPWNMVFLQLVFNVGSVIAFFGTFTSSPHFASLGRTRRRFGDPQQRKQLTFAIRKFHRQKLRQWKNVASGNINLENLNPKKWPLSTWDSILQEICRFKTLEFWTRFATNRERL